MAEHNELREVTVTLNLTKAQAIAIEVLLAQWNWLASVGASRWTAFYADGDGNFRPHATIDGRTPDAKRSPFPAEKFWNGNEFRVDFDPIAWSLRTEAENG